MCHAASIFKLCVFLRLDASLHLFDIGASVDRVPWPDLGSNRSRFARVHITTDFSRLPRHNNAGRHDSGHSTTHAYLSLRNLRTRETYDRRGSEYLFLFLLSEPMVSEWQKTFFLLKLQNSPTAKLFQQISIAFFFMNSQKRRYRPLQIHHERSAHT